MPSELGITNGIVMPAQSKESLSARSCLHIAVCKELPSYQDMIPVLRRDCLK